MRKSDKRSMALDQLAGNKPRRTRTTEICIAVPTTLKAVAEHLGVSSATVTARYHRIQDAYPNRVVRIEQLATSHKTKPFKGRF